MNNIWFSSCAAFLCIAACLGGSCNRSRTKPGVGSDEPAVKQHDPGSAKLKPARTKPGVESDEPAVKQQDPGSAKLKPGALEAIVESVTFNRFDANDVSVGEVLDRIEKKINQAIAPRKVRVTTINSTDGRITIVLRNVTIKTLLDLITDQTTLRYRLDDEKSEIYLYSNEDTIGE